nr:MAG TPA: Gametolysin peptidase M11 [Caudoviricetes sp.]
MSDETAKNTEGTNHGAEPDYSEHFTLTAKGKGCSGKLYGNVTLVAFLVHDRSSAWKDGDIDKIKSVLEKAAKLIKEKSGLTDNRLKVSYAFDDVPIQFRYDGENYEHIVHEVLKQYGFDNAADYQAHYEKKFKKDEAPLIFIINRNFRSFARNVESGASGSEYSFVSFNDDTDSCIRTMIHEVLHQFGAIDYYLPETVKKAAEKIFPDSIMLHGLEIDDLTRYIIGWDKKLSDKAKQFLNETSGVTEKEIAEAREKDRDNDW